jgi:hypothetical protein
VSPNLGTAPASTDHIETGRDQSRHLLRRDPALGILPRQALAFAEERPVRLASGGLVVPRHGPAVERLAGPRCRGGGRTGEATLKGRGGLCARAALVAVTEL